MSLLKVGTTGTSAAPIRAVNRPEIEMHSQQIRAVWHRLWLAPLHLKEGVRAVQAAGSGSFIRSSRGSMTGGDPGEQIFCLKRKQYGSRPES